MTDTYSWLRKGKANEEDGRRLLPVSMLHNDADANSSTLAVESGEDEALGFDGSIKNKISGRKREGYLDFLTIVRAVVLIALIATLSTAIVLCHGGECVSPSIPSPYPPMPKPKLPSCARNQILFVFRDAGETYALEPVMRSLGSPADVKVSTRAGVDVKFVADARGEEFSSIQEQVIKVSALVTGGGTSPWGSDKTHPLPSGVASLASLGVFNDTYTSAAKNNKSSSSSSSSKKSSRCAYSTSSSSSNGNFCGDGPARLANRSATLTPTEMERLLNIYSSKEKILAAEDSPITLGQRWQQQQQQQQQQRRRRQQRIQVPCLIVTGLVSAVQTQIAQAFASHGATIIGYNDGFSYWSNSTGSGSGTTEVNWPNFALSTDVLSYLFVTADAIANGARAQLVRMHNNNNNKINTQVATVGSPALESWRQAISIQSPSPVPVTATFMYEKRSGGGSVDGSDGGSGGGGSGGGSGGGNLSQIRRSLVPEGYDVPLVALFGGYGAGYTASVRLIAHAVAAYNRQIDHHNHNAIQSVSHTSHRRHPALKSSITPPPPRQRRRPQKQKQQQQQKQKQQQQQQQPSAKSLLQRGQQYYLPAFSPISFPSSSPHSSTSSPHSSTSIASSSSSSLPLKKLRVAFMRHPGPFNSTLERAIFAQASVPLIVINRSSSGISAAQLAAVANVTVSQDSTCCVQSLFLGKPALYAAGDNATATALYSNVAVEAGLIPVGSSVAQLGRIFKTMAAKHFDFDTAKLAACGIPTGAVDIIRDRLTATLLLQE